ncbi:MAG: S8 family serine peptidase [Thermodesulfobacteriota bacterium]
MRKLSLSSRRIFKPYLSQEMVLIEAADPSSSAELITAIISSTLVSTNIQDGDDNPTEILIDIVNPGVDPITAGIVIFDFLKFFGLGNAEPREFDLFVLTRPLDEFAVSQSSVPNNPDADLVLSIGASGLGLLQSIDQIRPYSSRGPTNDGRIKPELVAPDGVTTTVPGFIPFFGTSAAAPHAAGVAALILEAEENLPMAKSGSMLTNQKLSPSEVSDVLRNSAVDLGPPGTDNTFGSGRIDAFAAVQSVVQQAQPTPTPIPTPTPTPSPTPTPTPTPSPSPTATPTVEPTSVDLQGDSNGGCTIGGSAQAGTAFVNLLIPLVPAFAIGLRMIRRRKKNTIASESHVKA